MPRTAMKDKTSAEVVKEVDINWKGKKNTNLSS